MSSSCFEFEARNMGGEVLPDLVARQSAGYHGDDGPICDAGFDPRALSAQMSTHPRYPCAPTYPISL